MRPAALLTLLGFTMLVVALFCPVLRPFHLFNWNVFQLNKPFGIVILMAGAIGILGSILGQAKLIRLAAYASLALVALLYLAVVIKVRTSFSFIPFKNINRYLTLQINFKWGWLLLFAGPLLAIAGTFFNKEPRFVRIK